MVHGPVPPAGNGIDGYCSFGLFSMSRISFITLLPANCALHFPYPIGHLQISSRGLVPPRPITVPRSGKRTLAILWRAPSILSRRWIMDVDTLLSQMTCGCRPMFTWVGSANYDSRMLRLNRSLAYISLIQTRCIMDYKSSSNSLAPCMTLST